VGKPRQGKALIAWLTKASFCSNHELRFAAVVKAAAMLPNEGSAGPKGLGRLLRLLPLSEFKQGFELPFDDNYIRWNAFRISRVE
jgi:hypothetical protein